MVNRQVYNTSSSFYTSDEISPLRKSMFAGTPVYVPNNISAILNQEYHKNSFRSMHMVIILLHNLIYGYITQN